VLAACGGAAATPTGVAVTPTGVSAVADPEAEAGTPEVEAEPDSGTENQTLPTPGSDSAGGKRLVLYTTRTESLIKPVIDAYKKVKPDVTIDLLTGQNAELSAKMLEERSNPRADLFINTDNLSMASLAAQGLFEPEASSEVMSVPEAYRAPDGSWAALTLRARVIMYNTDLVTAEEAPQSMFDLTDPKWNGQIGAANSANGSLQAQVAAIRNLLGEAKATEFLKGLVANDTQFFPGHTDVRKAVGSGELKLGLVNHYYYQLSKAEGAPVGVVYPDQGSGEMGVVVNSTNAGIIEGAPHEEEAEEFVEYLLTPEGQKIFAEVNYEYPVVPGVALAEGVRPLEAFRQANVTMKTLYDELQPTQNLMQEAGIP
jgi:iron(III) transport system substrate-binding protein